MTTPRLVLEDPYADLRDAFPDFAASAHEFHGLIERLHGAGHTDLAETMRGRLTRSVATVRRRALVFQAAEVPAHA
ncbi:MAG: hypothetical protein AB7I08_12310 [Thermoleophilia bacterium]